MNALESVIYGIIQALCEFLPISSSGHLAFLPKMLEIDDPGVAFDLFLHVGTSLSLIVYFRKSMLMIAKAKLNVFRNIKNLGSLSGYDAYVANLVLATFSTILFILILKPFAESYGRQLQLIALNLAVFGFFLYYFDKKSKNLKIRKDLEKVDWKFSLFFGFSQAIAVFPGVSRSGATLTMGRISGFKRRDIAEFTFLLSIPIIILGAVYKGLKLYQNPEQVNFDWTSVSIGLVVSFVLGVLVIHYFLKFVNRVPFLFFFLYRVLIALIILSYV